MSPLLYQLSYTATERPCNKRNVCASRLGNASSADKIWIEAIDGSNKGRLNLVMDDRSADLPKAAENSLDDHLFAFMNLGPALAPPL